MPFIEKTVSNPVKILIALAALGGLIWLTLSVQSALVPFVLAAVAAYVCAPLARKLENRGCPPALAATLIVFLLLIILLLLPLALVPLVAAQVREFAELLPPLIDKLQNHLRVDFSTLLTSEKIGELGSIGALGNIDGEQVKTAVSAAAGVFGGGISLLSSFFTILLITPLATFYFLRDRISIGGEMTELLPPHLRERTVVFIREIDNVLDEFLHGQLIVMAVMAAFYSVVLKLAGLPFAFTLGIISGVLTFIPYVGFICGIILATIVGAGYFESFWDMAIVWLLMGIGTTVESVVITPRLVGERVGLHPLVVLFSLFVMGELFGFIGVLTALPFAAILLVCGRHLRRHYISSDFYGRQ